MALPTGPDSDSSALRLSQSNIEGLLSVALETCASRAVLAPEQTPNASRRIRLHSFGVQQVSELAPRSIRRRDKKSGYCCSSRRVLCENPHVVRGAHPCFLHDLTSAYLVIARSRVPSTSGGVRRTRITRKICVQGHRNRSARNFVDRQGVKRAFSVIAVILAKWRSCSQVTRISDMDSFAPREQPFAGPTIANFYSFSRRR